MPVEENEIVAIALLTREDVAMLGSALKKVFLIEATPRFDELTRWLDEAERTVLTRQHGPDPPARS